MKVVLKVEKQFDIKYVFVQAAVRYDEEDMPKDFPFRIHDMWEAKIEINEGRVIGWPEGKKGSFHMKVCDEGTYILLDAQGEEITRTEGYVPNHLLPPSDGYGDYLELHIGENGIISNWYSQPSLIDFIED